MKITLSGTAGTGKGTIADLLVEKYHLTYYDLGNLRREEAVKRGMTIAQFNEWSEQNPQGDTFFDEKQALIGKSEDNFIFVGRLSWYFIPDAIKILLTVSEEAAAKRIFSHMQAKGRIGETAQSYEQTLEMVQTRNASDLKRYAQQYGITQYAQNNFDLVVDTTNLTIPEVFERIVLFVDARVHTKTSNV